MENYILPLADWFYRHCGDDYYQFIEALDTRAKQRKLDLPIRCEPKRRKKPKKLKSKKKKKKKIRKTQKYTNKSLRRYRQG